MSVGIFAVITTSAALKYGLTTHWSLLDTLPSTVVLHLAAFLVAIQLSITSAVSNSALYQHLEDSLGIKRGKKLDILQKKQTKISITFILIFF